VRQDDDVLCTILEICSVYLYLFIAEYYEEKLCCEVQRHIITGRSSRQRLFSSIMQRLRKEMKSYWRLVVIEIANLIVLQVFNSLNSQVYVLVKMYCQSM
jgi:hypothetical protein